MQCVHAASKVRKGHCVLALCPDLPVAISNCLLCSFKFGTLALLEMLYCCSCWTPENKQLMLPYIGVRETISL